MNVSAPFIRRPVATSLCTLALALAGTLAFRNLPVSPIPQVEFPTLMVTAALPGADPETMASAVAMPLERQFGRIAGVTEMTSTSSLGTTAITLQFDLSRNIDAAARDVQAAINAARGYLPSNLPNNPFYRKVNPADSPIFMLALTSPVLRDSVRCAAPAARALGCTEILWAMSSLWESRGPAGLRACSRQRGSVIRHGARPWSWMRPPRWPGRAHRRW
jgi:multidrug efflux pump subunit AcrB